VSVGRDRFRGGRRALRDRWFGLEEKPDFADFRHWWHRQGKDEAGGNDINDRQAADHTYEDWVRHGRPTMK
jgi:hypothetical protein